jgi:subtilase family serine protease
LKRQVSLLTLIMLMIIVLFSGNSPSIADDLTIKGINRRALPTTVGEPQVSPAIVKRIINLPDLSITRFKISLLKIHSGETIKLEALVKNSGKITSPNTIVRFVNMKTRKKLGEDRVTLSAGQQKKSTITIPIAGSGTINIQVIVDPDNRIKEANENNNKAKTLLRFAALRAAKIHGKSGIQRPVIVDGAKKNGQEESIVTKSCDIE